MNTAEAAISRCTVSQINENNAKFISGNQGYFSVLSYQENKYLKNEIYFVGTA